MPHIIGGTDMTRGPIIKRSVLFALPICAGNILQQLYSTVDIMVLGNFCDVEEQAAALAAVATSSQPLEILLCVFLGIGSGVSILVSQRAGSGNEELLQKLSETAVWFLYVCAVPLTVIGLLIGPWILRFMQVPPDTMDNAIHYLRITTLGCIGNMGYNLNAGILRGLGNSVSSVLLLIVTSVVNIALDLVLVAGLGMGVAGAALATSVAMLLSWLFSIWYLKRLYPQISLHGLPWGFDSGTLKDIIRVGLPLGFNSALYSLGHLLLQTLFNAQGTIFVAGCSVAGKVNSIANVAITSFSSASAVFAGQNLGAGDYRRLRRGMVCIPLFSGAVTLAAGLVVTLYCRPILALFNRDPNVLDMAVRYVRIVLPFTWNYAVYNGIMCFFNGMGEIRYTTIVNILLLWAVRIPAAWLLSVLGYGQYAMASIPMSFAVGLAATLFCFKSRCWAGICAKAQAQSAE